jgi:hypothetical protein
MDIIVTTPKKEIATSKKEGDYVKKHGGQWFRTFKYKPKVEAGDKIYFVEAGAIKGYGIVREVSSASATKCDVTGREWKGKYIVKYDTWHWLKAPVEFKGFRGIRYIERIPWLKELLRGGKKW